MVLSASTDLCAPWGKARRKRYAVPSEKAFVTGAEGWGRDQALPSSTYWVPAVCRALHQAVGERGWAGVRMRRLVLSAESRGPSGLAMRMGGPDAAP